jgi:predicted RecB family nuclease
LKRVPCDTPGRPAEFTPIRFIFANTLAKHDRLLLAFDALVLSETLGREVDLGKIIHGDDYITLSVRTAALQSEVRKIAAKITTLLSSQTAPDLVLNRHCAECEFRDRCRQKAIESNDLSLLSNMTESEWKHFTHKGIFTVTQLSYTFRPRKRPKHMRDRREPYHHSLKALAIREHKIHIVGSPTLAVGGTPVFLDVECVPDRGFYYLIGMRVSKNGSFIQHSFWADTPQDERRIWTDSSNLGAGQASLAARWQRRINGPQANARTLPGRGGQRCVRSQGIDRRSQCTRFYLWAGLFPNLFERVERNRGVPRIPMARS